MAFPKRVLAVMVLSAVGALLMLLQSHEFFQLRSGAGGFESFCTIGAFDCQATESSAYAEILPGFPLAGAAAAFFVWIISAAAFMKNPYWRRETLRLLWASSLLGVVVSGFYLVIMVTQLDVLCLFCLGIDAIHVANFVLITSLKPEGFKTHRIDASRMKTLGLVGTFASLVTLGLVKALDVSPSLPRSEADALLQSVLQAKPVEVQLGESPITMGPSNAPITIVKFSDFQCPSCKRGALHLHPVFRRFPHQIRLVYKNFPLDSKCNRGVNRDMHPVACEAAQAAFCAFQKGHFKKIYEGFFEEQSELGVRTPTAIAVELGMSEQSLKACMASVETQAAVNQDIEEGMRLKIQGTPTYFINGRRAPSGLTPELWIKVIQSLLKKKS